MRFVGINGEVHNKDISSYKRTVGNTSKSEGQKRLAEILETIWPNVPIYEEVPCFGSQLKLDFYIPFLDIAFEFDGIQHNKFLPFFHNNMYNFMRAKNRDEEKEKWCIANNITLIRIVEKELDEAIIREKINAADSR